MEKIKIEDIIAGSKKLGACNSADGIKDWKGLIEHFFSPQGREFCKKYNYPGVEAFRAASDEIRQYKVYVDTDEHITNENAALVGHSTSTLHFSGVGQVYKVMLMHGAKAKITAGNYAVVRIDNISGDYEVENDGTAIIIRR